MKNKSLLREHNVANAHKSKKVFEFRKSTKISSPIFYNQNVYWLTSDRDSKPVIEETIDGQNSGEKITSSISKNIVNSVVMPSNIGEILSAEDIYTKINK